MDTVLPESLGEMSHTGQVKQIRSIETVEIREHCVAGPDDIKGLNQNVGGRKYIHSIEPEKGIIWNLISNISIRYLKILNLAMYPT